MGENNRGNWCGIGRSKERCDFAATRGRKLKVEGYRLAGGGREAERAGAGRAIRGGACQTHRLDVIPEEVVGVVRERVVSALGHEGALGQRGRLRLHGGAGVGGALGRARGAAARAGVREAAADAAAAGRDGAGGTAGRRNGVQGGRDGIRVPEGAQCGEWRAKEHAGLFLVLWILHCFLGRRRVVEVKFWKLGDKGYVTRGGGHGCPKRTVPRVQ